MSHYQPKSPIILVGTKCDLRGLIKDKTQEISSKEAQQVANKIKAVKYLECSAKTQKGVTEVFVEAILAATGKSVVTPQKQRKCVIL